MSVVGIESDYRLPSFLIAQIAVELNDIPLPSFLTAQIAVEFTCRSQRLIYLLTSGAVSDNLLANPIWLLWITQTILARNQ